MCDPFIRRSGHARARLQQRGTSRRLYIVQQDYADTIAHIGRGTIASSVSRSAACEMRADGVRSDEISRARRRAHVEIDGVLLTIIVGRQQKGQRYFRNRPRRLSDRRRR